MRKEIPLALAILAACNFLVWCFWWSPVSPPPPEPALVVPPAFQPLRPLPEVRPVEPDFVVVPVYRKAGEDGSVYADVIGHSRGSPFGNGSGRSTNVHETAHGIHSELRNAYRQKLAKKVNGFYALQGRGIIVEEPTIRKSAVNRFVPENLRSYRYSTYLAGQREWDDTPLYLCDEWVAYILGGMCCVDDVKQGRHRGGWTDGVSGCLDFSIYVIALCMAIKDGDPDYWRTNAQCKNFVIWMMRQAHQTYQEGSVMEQFRWEKQDRLLAELRSSQSAEPMRKFLREELEGLWLETSVDKIHHLRLNWLLHGGEWWLNSSFLEPSGSGRCSLSK